MPSRMARTGRPKIQIDKIMFEKLCGLMCTEDDIANFFNCSIDTINNWCKSEYDMTFSDIYKKKSVVGLISLRRNQWKLSEKNAAMAIFLGKQYLGQTDKVETTGEIKTTPTIKLEVVDNSNLESVLYEDKK